MVTKRQVKEFRSNIIKSIKYLRKCIFIYLNGLKVMSNADAAVMADKFVLGVFSGH